MKKIFALVATSVCISKLVAQIPLDSENFNTYAPTRTGVGASGTWGISITGNAVTWNGQPYNAATGGVPTYLMGFNGSWTTITRDNLRSFLGMPVTGDNMQSVLARGDRYYVPGAESVIMGLGRGIASPGQSTYIGWRNNGGAPYGYIDTYLGGAPLVLQPTSGNVGIGVTNPTQKLSVAGTVLARKVKVSQPPSADWPDYVFDSSYRLPSLAQVENYIQVNKHLPEVPSAAEVTKDGLDLGDSQAVLLKKIEELTLYLIEQNKEIKKLREEVNELRDKR